MATISIYCQDGTPDLDFENEQEQETWEYLMEYYGGDVDAAYEKFHSIHRNDEREQYLRNSNATRVIEGFSLEQQRSVVQMIKKMTFNSFGQDTMKTNGRPNMGIIRDKIRNYFDTIIRENVSNDAYRSAKVNDILNNYDEFWKMAQQEMERMGLETNDNGEVVKAEGIDAERRNWDDYARFVIDPKDTASTRVKLTMAFIPKKEFEREDGEVVTGEDNLPKIKNKTNFLGFTEFAPMDSMYDKVGEILSDFIPSDNVDNTYQAYVDHLKDIGQSDPQVMAVVNKLKNMQDSPSFQADFVNTFGKTYTRESMILLSPIYSRKGRQTKHLGFNLNVIDSNRTSQVQAVKEAWAEDQKTLPMVSEDKEGDLRIDQDEVRDIRDQYVSDMREHLEDGGSLTDTEGLKLVQNTLGSVGLSVRYETLEHLSQNPEDLGIKNWEAHVHPDTIADRSPGEQKGLMYYVFDTFLTTTEAKRDDLETHGKLGLNNPLTGRDSQGVVNKLAKTESQYAPKLYAPSFRNVEGNQIHALQDHTSLTREFARLENNPEQARSERGVYDSRSVILRAIENDEGDIRDLLDIEYTDGLKRINRTEGSPYENMSTSEKELTRLALFQNPQKNDRVKFMAPTLSDKSREYLITLPKIHEMYGEERWIPVNDESQITEDGDLNLDPAGVEGKVLLNIAEAEIERIKNVQDLMEDMNPEDHPFGEDYMWEGQFFYHFPELNPAALGDDVDRLWYEETINGNNIYKLKDTIDSRRFIRQRLTESLEESVEQTKRRWREKGIARSDDTSDWLMDRTYLKSTPYGLRDTERKRTYAALDYHLSNRFFNSEITKILAGDPALHVDRSDGRNELAQDPNIADELRFEDPETINQTIVNHQKRLANHVAPALTQNIGAHVTNENQEDTSEVNIVTLQDRFVDSKHIDHYEELFDDQLGNPQLAEAYRGIESTDAQEYTTLREHIRTQLLNGEISKELHDKIVDRINETQENDGPRNFFKLSSFLSPEELKHVLMPHKDVYVGRNYHEHLGATNWIYRKTSSIPLIPEVTTGTDLDNLRVAMEEEGVDRVAYQSADKTGAYNPFDPFQDEGRREFMSADQIREQIITDEKVNNPSNDLTENDKTVQTVNRRDLGLQFQIPIKEDREITRISQLDKLLTQNIKSVEGFNVPWKDESVDGKELELMKQETIAQIWENGKDELLNELDARVVDNSSGTRTIHFDNVQRLQEVLQREAEARDWSPSAIDSIQIENDEFILPLSFSPASSSIESLLLSILQDRTTNQQMPGKSFVQVSHAGWHGISDKGSVRTTSNFDPETGLKHARVEDGEVKPAQIMITWDFKDENAEVLNIEDYTDENGNIDDSKLDPELRKLIGARIPNQAGSSSLPVEVVGFLPPQQAKTMIVTEEIVAQMGSDFDVDKVYTYMDKYIEDDGYLRRQNESDDTFSENDRLKRRYKEIHWAALTNPDALARVLKPLDMEYLSDEADFIEDAKSTEGEISDFLSPHFQVDSHNDQHAGKDLIGNFSLASNFNSMLEMDPITLSENAQVVIRTDEGMQELNQFGGHGMRVDVSEDTQVLIPDVLMMLQNAALDNAKELILDKINATQNTAETIATAAMLNDGQEGIALPQLARFFAQEAIEMYDEQLDLTTSQTNNQFISDRNEFAANTVFNNILQNFDSEDRSWILSQVEDTFNTGQEDVYVEIPRLSQLNEDIRKNGTGAIQNDRQYAANQLKYLRAFRELEHIQNELTNVRSVINFGDRNGPGKSLLHSKNKLDDYNNLDDTKYLNNVDAVANRTEWESAVENSFKLAWEMYNPQGRDLFHYNSAIFNDVKYEIEQNKGNQIGPDDALDVFREMKSFVFSSDYMFDNPEAERKKLLEGTENVDDIATRVKEAQDTWGKDNFFLSRLRPQLPDGQDDIATVLFSSDKGDRTDDVRLIQEFATLLGDKDPKKRLLAEDLVKYAYLVSGGVQTPTTFMQYVPISYLTEEVGLKDAIRNFDFDNNEGDAADRFMTQYFQHNPEQARVIDRDDVSDMRKRGRLPKQFKSRDYSQLIRQTFDGDEPIPFVSMYDTRADKWRLYQYGGDGHHYEIDTLGKANEGGYNTVEYNLNKDKRIWSSMVKDNQTRLKRDPFQRQDGSEVDDTVDSMDRLIRNESEIDAETFYQSVRDNEEDPYVAKLADFMEDIDTDFRIKIAPQRFFNTETTDAHYNPERLGENEIWLSEDMLARGRDRTYVTRATLHELMHKQTLALARQDASERTDRQNELLRNLKRTMDEVLEKSNPPKRLENAMRMDGEINFHEFLAYSIANEEGAEWLKSVELDRGENAFESVINSIVDIIKSVAESLGINVNDNSALAYTIRDTLELFEETAEVKDRTPSDPESRTKSEVEEQNQTEEQDPTQEGFGDQLKDKLGNSGNNQDLGQSVGEFRRQLSDRQKKVFDQIRTRINTRCD